MGVGAIFVISGTANIIEETTEVLHERTKIAGGLLQSIGTAFPDMVLGIVAAIASLKFRDTNYALAINYAIIAASTTFGSNIYNIGHAAYCLYRQNLANLSRKTVLMIPYLKMSGILTPIKDQTSQPTIEEFDNANTSSVALSLLTAITAISMVVFGKIDRVPENLNSDLYQLLQPIGIITFILALAIIFHFRKSKRNTTTPEIEIEERYFRHKSTLVIIFCLVLAGIAIMFSAEAMIKSIEVFCDITGLPFVVAGVLSGIIGCLGEMTVVHNYSVHPNGRLGDAVMGVAMDNIVTIMGASIVAVMGGIFLGGSALILIFVVILTLNSILIWQISQLKNYLK